MEYLIAAQIVFDIIVIIFITWLTTDLRHAKTENIKFRIEQYNKTKRFIDIVKISFQGFTKRINDILFKYIDGVEEEKNRVQGTVNELALRTNTIEGKIFVDRISQEINKEILEQLKKLNKPIVSGKETTKKKAGKK